MIGSAGKLDRDGRGNYQSFDDSTNTMSIEDVKFETKVIDQVSDRASVDAYSHTRILAYSHTRDESRKMAP